MNFLKKATKFLIPFMFVGNTFAANFLVSDPWPTTVAQPLGCVAITGPTSVIVLTLVDAAPGSKQIKHDLTGVPVGPKSWPVACWNDSSIVRFDPLGGPLSPTNLRTQ